jgi:carbamate kinase
MEDLGHPCSYLVVRRGTPVFSSDGKKLGRVVKVHAAPEAHMFDGILFDTNRGPGGRRFVDAPEVGEIYERGIVLKIAAAEVESLPKRR